MVSQWQNKGLANLFLLIYKKPKSWSLRLVQHKMTIPEDFKTRLKIAKSKIKKQLHSDSEKRGSFMGSAFKLGTELVAAVAVGTIIGFILDNWFDTKPWLIIIFFFLGTAAGILNVIRTASRMQKEN